MLKEVNELFKNSTNAGKNIEISGENQVISFNEVGIDSMEFIEFLLKVERVFDVKIDEEYWNIKILRDTAAVADYIAGKRMI